MWGNNKDMPASMILSTLASLIPLIWRRSFLGEKATDSTVQRPASLSFLTSMEAMPDTLSWGHRLEKPKQILFLKRYAIKDSEFGNRPNKRWQ